MTKFLTPVNACWFLGLTARCYISLLAMLFFFSKSRLQNTLFHGAGWQLEANVFVKQTLKSAEFVAEAWYQHKQFYQST